MKHLVKLELKEKGHPELFTDNNYDTVKELMGVACKRDTTLKNYLSISPDFKAAFIADHIIKFYKQ